MNTNHLKKFAQTARRKLLQQVEAKLEYALTHDTAELREKAKEIKALQNELQRIGKTQLIDKVAYTWFNRLMALRFMDANDYQPSGIRIVSPKDGYTLPQLLDEAKQAHFPDQLPVDQQKVLGILDGRVPSKNPQNEAYRQLLIAACNALHKQFPFLFERINDYTELLLPDDLTSEFSILHELVEGMSAEDCQEVEIIGWLYQFYISEKKDEVFASKSKVKAEDIPAATQLFTPRWIVEYMVQNTVGKLWLQNKPTSRLREHMPYFIESPSVNAEDYLKIKSVEEITLLDQACGSGHILVYGFELLSKIYEEEGYPPSEIPKLIIEKNLYGFEIDERAAQLAGLALLMKARAYYRRVFRKPLQPNILQYQDLVLGADEVKETFKQLDIPLSDELQHDLRNMQQATNLGSLIRPHASKQELQSVAEALENKQNTSADVFLAHQVQQLHRALVQLQLLANKYHCVVDNPPYMGGGKMNKALGDWVKVNYPKSKADLMVCFMERAQYQVYDNGFVGMINLPSWMFLSSFEDYRKELNAEYSIDSLLHLGRGIFGSDFGSVAFTFIKQKETKTKGVYRRLFEKHVQVRSVEKIRKLFLDRTYGFYTAHQKDFEKIPGSPIGYWLSEKMASTFLENKIDYFTISGGRCKTHNDTKFTRKIWEINLSGLHNYWKVYENGGDARLWYGNHFDVVNWQNNSREYYKAKGGLTKPEFWQREGIVWNMITSSLVSFRIKPNFSEYSSGAPVLFCKDENCSENYLLGLLNSKIVQLYLKLLNPTINTSVGIVQKIPVKIKEQKLIESGVINLIEIAKSDWISNETSWEFKQNELFPHKAQDLEETYDLYRQYWKNKFSQLHQNEEELNRQFIEIYGLQDELTSEVPLDEITILKEETSIENGELIFDANEVFAQFVSYSVGCMFGRYSLDKKGLILANQGETLGDYWEKLGLPAPITPKAESAHFMPDDDAIIPVLDDEWFEDDIVGRFYEFLRVTFGKKDFQKNLTFLEEQLGKDVRKYFVKDFYNDHIKRYKKRPIYWLFSSPKGSFSVLVYLHRYTPDTINNILNNYLREFIQKLKSQKQHFQQMQVSGSTAEQNQATKQIDTLDKMILDCEEYERDILFPLATERIAIDLDDGVLVNYNKLGSAVKMVSGLNDKKAKAKVRGFDWIDVEGIRD